jgi:hypothetical protein
LPGLIDSHIIHDVNYACRDHERLQFGNGNIWFDTTKVTNDQYAEFLLESGWRPQTEQNWLKSWDWQQDEPVRNTATTFRAILY